MISKTLLERWGVENIGFFILYFLSHFFFFHYTHFYFKRNYFDINQGNQLNNREFHRDYLDSLQIILRNSWVLITRFKFCNFFFFFFSINCTEPLILFKPSCSCFLISLFSCARLLLWKTWLCEALALANLERLALSKSTQELLSMRNGLLQGWPLIG